MASDQPCRLTLGNQYVLGNRAGYRAGQDPVRALDRLQCPDEYSSGRLGAGHPQNRPKFSQDGGVMRAEAESIVPGSIPVPVLQQKGTVSQKTGKEHNGLYK